MIINGMDSTSLEVEKDYTFGHYFKNKRIGFYPADIENLKDVKEGQTHPYNEYLLQPLPLVIIYTRIII